MTGTTAKSGRTGAIRPALLETRFPTFIPSYEGESGPDETLGRLNLNEAIFPPSDAAIAAARDALAFSHRYPDDFGTALKSELSTRTGIAPEAIHLGSGSSELLFAAVQISIEAGDHAVLPAPTFPVCAKAITHAGGRMTQVPVRADGANDVDAMLAAITAETRLFYLCTPNNPTGADLSADDLARAIANVPDQCLLLIDEAYMEFAVAEGGVDALSLIGDRSGPWMITRTFSKVYCLSALRVGYAFSSGGDVSQALNQVRANFTVSRPALAAALAALKDDDYLRHVLSATINARHELAKGLSGLACSVLPSRANFLTVRPHSVSAVKLAAQARDAGLLVQAMPWPDAIGSLRLTIGTPSQNETLLAVLRAGLGEG
ncbi:MAG: pyridoxal phosphate-dependent aminotransferase [Yoonia sp.]|uniref:pyridoxal phosphate-dependent aminotransferase n=1 Tax=Yoonia sp. TaxID=2212373 RepID=UPI003EF2ACA8